MILRRLKPTVKRLPKYYVFDTETCIYNKKGQFKYDLNGRPESFKFGVIYGKNHTRVLRSLQEMKDALNDPIYKGAQMFAHNLEYDGNTIYDNIYAFDPSAIFNGRLIAFTNGNVKFADSFNIYKMSVAQIGDIIGKPKTMTYNRWKKEISTADINGCIRDCEIIYDALFTMFHAAGSIKITQASLSITYFRREFQPYDIKHNELQKYFWQSYYGGRTEAFKIGKTNSVAYDINSSYPSAMIECKFPNPSLMKTAHFPDARRFKKILQNYEGCAKVTIEHKQNWIGLLPYKKKGKLIFPVGTFTGTWNFNELRYAINTGLVTIKQVHNCVYAPSIDSPFIDYIKVNYRKRLEVGKGTIQGVNLKVFMNCLYGKFAQKIEEQWIYIDDIEARYMDTIKKHMDAKTFIKISMFSKERKDCFLVVKSGTEMKISYQIPSFSSYITSFARIRLLDKMIEKENYRPVYCDTDSIFFEIDPQIKTSSKLGEWDKEDKIVTEILGLKNYRYKENGELYRRLKGVPKTATEISPNVFVYENLIKTKESLRRNLDAGVRTKRTKKINNVYDKREILKNGETKPIKL